MGEFDDDLFRGYGVEVELPAGDGAFLKVRETLERVGIRRGDRLYQSAHILHKRGRYIICSFKELFALDGRETTLTEEDVGRRNAIALLLQRWGLVRLVDGEVEDGDPVAPPGSVDVIPYRDRGRVELCPKYAIGRTKTRH